MSDMNLAEVTQHLFPCFSRAEIAFSHGQGSWLIDTNDARYLDYATGIAVTGLGHSHPDLVDVLVRQSMRVWHVSNAVRIPEQEALAELLCQKTFAESVFFCNSGAEAIEASIKAARRFHFANGHPERQRIVTFEGAFHGRTLATIAAGGREKYLVGFGPVVPGFEVVPFGDLRALDAACAADTAAVLVEPIQGESGVRGLNQGDLERIRILCDRRGALLIVDEVQTGVGRTGHLFAYQHSAVTPDILAAAKGLGNGFPVAACLATEQVAASMTPGTHGSTFGGNPLAMAVAKRVVEIIADDDFLHEVQRKAMRLYSALSTLAEDFSDVFTEVRGQGLLLGLRCVAPVELAVSTARANGLLCVAAGDNVMRLLPPLNLADEEIDEGLRRLQSVARSLRSGQ